MRAFLVGTTALAFAAVGCADNTRPDDDPGQVDQGPDETDSTDPPTPEESARDFDELAEVLGAHVRGEFAIMLAAAEISESRTPEGFVLAGDGTGSGAIGSMRYSFNYWCNAGDAAHTVVPCDGTAHHSHIQIEMSGSQTVGPMVMDRIDRYVDWEIRDITLDKARFRGPDRVTLSTSVVGADGVSATYSLNFDATYEQVRFMPAATFPTFGTIDFKINTERVRGDDRRVFLSNAQLVYGSSGEPTTLTFDGEARYRINLTTGDVQKL